MKVALIDSGVNAHHSHVGGPVRGVAVVQDEQGLVSYGPEFRDRLGHGTAVAGCIRLFAPTVELLAVSVFDGGARASARQLAAAIDWAVAARPYIHTVLVSGRRVTLMQRSHGAARLRVLAAAIAAPRPHNSGRADSQPLRSSVRFKLRVRQERAVIQPPFPVMPGSPNQSASGVGAFAFPVAPMRPAANPTP